MPELPEVETITNQLKDLVVGRTITQVQVPDPWIVKYPGVTDFVEGLRERRIESVERRAKRILIRLSSGQYLTLQLMTTGQFLLVSPDQPLRRTTRLILDLDDGRQLRLADSSRFARVNLLDQRDLGEKLHLDELGPEAISDELTLERFQEMLKGRRRPIKPLLLNQGFVSGLGNIYTDESLFAAGIHPARPAGSLSTEESTRLYQAMRRILREAIALRGTTTRSYLDVLGRKGGYQEKLKVVLRAGEPCFGCPGLVERTNLAGRETFICPSCQRLDQ